MLGDLKETHKPLKEFVDASSKKIRENEALQQLQKYYQFFVGHCDRKPYQIEFTRCDNTMCHHCSSLPERDIPLIDLRKEFGGSIPIPTESLFHRGHFDTFLDIYNSLSQNSRQVSPLYSHGVCEYGGKYGFFSKADKIRHDRLMKH